MNNSDNVSCSTARLNEFQLRSLSSSEKCCQGIVYVGMSRKQCCVLIISSFLFLLYLVTLLSTRNPTLRSSPRPATIKRARESASVEERNKNNNNSNKNNNNKKNNSPQTEERNAFRLISASDLLPIFPRALVPTLKNPCWLEEESGHPDPYDGNPYVISSGRARHSFERLLQVRALREQQHQQHRQRRRRQSPARRVADSTSPSSSLATPRLRCVPYFYIAGMPKCGTTDLYAKLTRHPDVVGGVMKEPHWWTRKRFGVFHPQSAVNVTTPASFGHYVDLFDEAAEDIISSPGETRDASLADLRSRKMIVDASASLLWDNDGWLNYLDWTVSSSSRSLPPLIASHLRHLHPGSKLVVMLRDPVTRLYSDYLYFRINAKKTTKNFHDRVVKSVAAFRDCVRVASLESCAYAPEVNNVVIPRFGASSSSVPRLAATSVRLRLGIYAVFLRGWLNQFPRDQILVIRLEDYAANGDAALDRIYDFLGISPTDRRRSSASTGHGTDDKSAQVANRGKVDIGPMMNETELILRRFYAEHNLALARLLGDDNFLWADAETGK